MDHYPAGPATVPAELTAPRAAYRQRAWLAMGLLALFVLLYLFLSGWFVWTSWRLFAAAADGGKDAFIGVIIGICASFLAVFMLKALFFVKHGGQIDDVEVTAAGQPRLFAFLHRLADEAGAPRPHRVFLSAQVNAAVFYDLSILNLLLPSRKNLVIGLGLVNVLNIGEFKAVCAHEFGHFAQRSMAVGRWVYIAQQIAGHIVAKRDMLDRFLDGLSRVDIRIAWVGWLLRLIVWSLRSLLDSAFTLVVLAQRSLSREMEMQADLVAVSLTGSDALIHALHRLQVADDAWDRTLNFLGGEFANKRMPKDAFTIQSHVIARMGELLNVADYGQVPPCTDVNPARHRLFKAEIAQPPRMWATHPFNHEREENAKHHYLAAAGDARSAWELFEQAEALREQVSASLCDEAEVQACPTEEAIARLDEAFHREPLKRAYRGVYYGRSPVRAAATPSALCGALEGAASQLDALYPESLRAELEQVASLEKELALLERLRDGQFSTASDELRHRGVSLQKKDLPATIATVKQELEAVQGRISAHDRLCRTVHRAAAFCLGQGWEDYLAGLSAVLHYADHSEANLRDAQRCFNNVLAMATAARRISADDRSRVIKEAGRLYRVLEQLFEHREALALDERLLARLEIGDWAEALGELGLLGPTSENLGDWIDVAGSWIDHAANLLAALRREALEELLECESRVAAWYRAGGTTEAAPQASRVPAEYPVLVPGQERPLQTRLDWKARFLTADGIVPGLARFAVAGSIVGSVLLLGNTVGSAVITVYNGLDRGVRVEIGPNSLQLAAHGFGTLESPPKGEFRLKASTLEGQEIEHFEAELGSSFATHIYNIAGASPLVEWTAHYGNASPQAERRLGAPRWSSSHVDHVFTQPPRQISSKSGGGTRTALAAAPADASPGTEIAMLANDQERRALIKAHARWDDAHSPYLIYWLSLAAQTGEQAGIVAARLRDNPDEVLARRLEQDMSTTPASLAQVCAAHAERARARPDNADRQYIAIRCLADKNAKSQAFIEAYRKWPRNGWLANAAGYSFAERYDWQAALEAWDAARSHEPALAPLVSLDTARVRRLLVGDKAARLDDLLASSDTLRQVLAVEHNRDIGEGQIKAYVALAQGQIAQAVELGRNNPADLHLLQLAAASEGASPALIGEALKLGVPEQNEDALPAMLALASREKRDTSAYAQALRRSRSEDAEAQLRFLALAQAGKLREADQALLGLAPQQLGQAFSMGVILLGQQAPSTWREGAKRLLFATERPWFR